MEHFSRIKRLPPYILSVLDELQEEMLHEGRDIFDFGLGNPDLPTAPHIVEALREAALNPLYHRYTPSRGIPELRKTISEWYGRRFNVDLDPERETIVTIGSKEGLGHLALATMSAGDTVMVPNPCYPIHHFGFVIADAAVYSIPLLPQEELLTFLERTLKTIEPKPKMLVLNFPTNPTAQCVDLSFFTRVVELAKEHKIWILQDLAYADLVFDDYKAPSILEVPGAKDIAVEAYTLSKSYNMAGWRVGFLCGNKILIDALARIKAYFDYGSFAAIQVAAIAALTGPQDCIKNLCQTYQARRDLMVTGLRKIGWTVESPKATMFLWVKMPSAFQHLGSLEFSKLLLRETGVRVSPGIAFGEEGNPFIRISLVESEERIRQALKQLEQMKFQETI